MIWLNAVSYCTQRYAVNGLLRTGRVQASIYSGLEPAANCRIKEDVKHVYFFSWVCCRCSWKGNRKLVPPFPRKPTKGVITYIFSINYRQNLCKHCYVYLHWSSWNKALFPSKPSDMNNDEYRCAKLLFSYWYKHIVDIVSRLKQCPSVLFGVLKKICDRSICICYIFIEHNTRSGK